MEKPIEVGKWAEIYRPLPCCGALLKSRYVPFIVTSILPSEGLCCPACHQLVQTSRDITGAPSGPNSRVPMVVCRRLDDPPAEEETIEDIARDLEISLR